MGMPTIAAVNYNRPRGDFQESDLKKPGRWFVALAYSTPIRGQNFCIEQISHFGLRALHTCRPW